MAEVVSVVEYNPEWSHQFDQEHDKLLTAFCDKAVAIEHIGSTSVRGLASKPIIDIAVGVADLPETDSLMAKGDASPTRL